MPSQVLLNILTFFYRDQFKFARSAFSPGYGYNASKTGNLLRFFSIFRITTLDPCHRRHELADSWASYAFYFMLGESCEVHTLRCGVGLYFLDVWGGILMYEVSCIAYTRYLYGKMTI